MFNKIMTPLTIIVSDGEWRALGDPNSPWHNYLMRVLNAQGGIAESVTNGTWTYNIVIKGFRIYAQLLPAE